MGIVFQWRTSTFFISCMCPRKFHLLGWREEWTMVSSLAHLWETLIYQTKCESRLQSLKKIKCLKIARNLSSRSKIADFYCFSLDKRQLEPRASMLNARTTHAFHLFDQKILGKLSNKYWHSMRRCPSSDRWFRWRREWYVIDWKLRHSRRSMVDLDTDSWCYLQDLATIVGHCASTSLYFCLSYDEFVHCHARRIFLWFGYWTMGQSTGDTWSSSLLSHRTTSISEEHAAVSSYSGLSVGTTV